MALTRGESQIQWSGSNSKVLTASTNTASDIMATDATDMGGALQISASCAGSPTATDNMGMSLALSCGHVTGGGSDDTDGSSSIGYNIPWRFYFGTTSTAPTQYENPTRKTFFLPPGQKSFRIYVAAPNASSRNVTVRAMYHYQRSA